MTLEYAVAILNRHHFLFCNHWRVGDDEAVGCNSWETLSSFTARAIATFYVLGFRPPPATPVITGVTLLTKGMGDMALTYSVQASDAGADVAQRQISYTLNGGAAATVDLAAGITCEPNDSVSVTLTDVGTDGIPSQPSAPFPFTAAAGPLAVGPNAPSITGVTQTS